MCYNKDQAGYITLISVLVVGVVGVAITLSMIQLGLGASRTSFAFEQANQAKAYANACVDDAFQQIRDNSLYTGTVNLNFERGGCSFTVTSQEQENRTINATGTVGTIIRKEKIYINAINPFIVPTLWQEVSN